MAIQSFYKYVIIGAGMHGLSTAYHLAEELKAKRRGSGRDILVIDKTAIGAGASGIACGVIRNNYYQPAMNHNGVPLIHTLRIFSTNYLFTYITYATSGC